MTKGIDGDKALVSFKLIPIDIAFMMIPEQHVPRCERLAVSVAFTSPAIDNLCSLLTFTIDVDPCVERVLENRNNASIADRHPIEGHRFAPVRRAGKMEIISGERNQGIVRATGLVGIIKLATIVRDESDTRLPGAARMALAELVEQIEAVSERIERLDREILATVCGFRPKPAGYSDAKPATVPI
ncbi:hypothetical protein BAE42_30890 [Mesorhizobium loti]|nr:hypothetical protein BAE42_30890 [Mesorhizobium loti]OBQ68009.1 hypothetical protein A8146_11430 [Mesorhizobium loti]